MSLPSTQTIKNTPVVEQVGLTTQRRVLKQRRVVKGPKDYLSKRVLERTYYNFWALLGCCWEKSKKMGLALDWILIISRGNS